VRMTSSRLVTTIVIGGVVFRKVGTAAPGNLGISGWKADGLTHQTPRLRRQLVSAVLPRSCPSCATFWPARQPHSPAHALRPKISRSGKQSCNLSPTYASHSRQMGPDDHHRGGCREWSPNSVFFQAGFVTTFCGAGDSARSYYLLP